MGCRTSVILMRKQKKRLISQLYKLKLFLKSMYGAKTVFCFGLSAVTSHCDMYAICYPFNLRAGKLGQIRSNLVNGYTKVDVD